MPYDHWSNILTTMRTKVRALNFTLTDPLPVNMRKLPSQEETIDPLPQIIICPDEQEPKIERYAFQTPSNPQGTARVTYFSDVIIVASNGGDNVSNLSTFTTWLQQVSELFSAPTGLSGITGLQDCRCTNLKFLDRSKVNLDYDYFGICVVARVFKSLTG